MIITDQQLNAFINLYNKTCGVRLSRQDAFEKGSKLIQLIKQLYPNKNLTKPNINKHEKHRKTF